MAGFSNNDIQQVSSTINPLLAINGYKFQNLDLKALYDLLSTGLGGNLADVLANGNLTNETAIQSNNSNSKIYAFNNLLFMAYENGMFGGKLIANDNRTTVEHSHEVFISATQILLNNGNVGIGTNTPTARLNVKGNIVVEESGTTVIPIFGQNVSLIKANGNGGTGVLEASNSSINFIRHISQSFAATYLKSPNGSFTAYYSNGNEGDPNASDLRMGSSNPWNQYIYFRSAFKIADVIGGDRLSIDGFGNINMNGLLNANSFSVAGSAGVSGSFTTNNGKTITVTGGLITNIV